MNSFLEFINSDIEAKKTLLTSMPVNNKANTRKFNEKLKSILEKYEEYDESIKKYLEVKSKSFMITNEKNTEALTKTIKALEDVRFILNPHNSYFEKMGFDTLLYKIRNYHDFKFEELNNIINEFLDKFAQVGINLSADDFNYTCYVNEFMSTFLSVRSVPDGNYEIVAQMFEKIYWLNPEIVGHVELNFRKLVNKYEKKFVEYIRKLQQEVTVGQGLDYDSALIKLKAASQELATLNKEHISDVIELAVTKKIDINNYFEDSKVRIANFDSLMVDQISTRNKELMAEFYENLAKLKCNIEEYHNYLKFMPLIASFKSDYLKKGDVAKDSSSLKSISGQISQSEGKLEKLNKKIFGTKKLFGGKANDSKELKFESVKQANALYELYKAFDEEYFKEKVSSLVNSTFSIADLLQLYYSYDAYKKMAIKKAFNAGKYDEIKSYSDEFDAFAVDPNNVVINGISLYEESNIAKVIVNKYRPVNINITEEDITAENLDLFLENIDFALRIEAIENSQTSIEKIWFMTEVARIEAAAHHNN